jgi:polygalacturonase
MGGCELLFNGIGYRTGPVWLVSNIKVVIAPNTAVFAVNRTTWVRSGFRYNKTDCCYPGVINGEGLRNVTLNGGGAIDGDGHEWWETVWDNNGTYRPHLTRFMDVHDLHIGGLHLRNSANHHIWVQDSVGVRIGGVAGDLSIYAPAAPESSHSRKSSPNTDGINIAGGTDTLIEGVRMHNNDDCVSVVASSGWKNGVMGYGGDVIVRNVSCDYSHGLSIGSVSQGK